MSWTVSISKTQVNGNNLVQYTYTDGTRTITDYADISSTTTMAIVISTAANRIAWLTGQDVNTAALVTGPIDPSLLVIVPPVTPTPEDPALTLYRTQYQTLKKLNELVDNGVLLATNASIVALQANLKATFQASYLNFI
jgi:hypothetical protein